jgi:hypothetical protein
MYFPTYFMMLDLHYVMNWKGLKEDGQGLIEVWSKHTPTETIKS